MTNSTDHVTPRTGLTVYGYVAKDGGSFAALTNSISEKAYGIYTVDLTATEMDADMITLRFIATISSNTSSTMKSDIYPK